MFGSCIIHILYTGCAKIKKKYFRRQRVEITELITDTFSLHAIWPHKSTQAEMYIYKAPNQISKIKFYGITNVAHMPSAIYLNMQNTNVILIEAEVLT